MCVHAACVCVCEREKPLLIPDKAGSAGKGGRADNLVDVAVVDIEP